MTAPGWREQAQEAFWTHLESMGYGRSEPTRDALSAALDAAEPLIRADADSRRIPGSEMYMAGVEAERERVTELAVTHRAVYQDEIGDTREFADLIEGDDQ